jgi:phage terminase small subunit
VSKPNDPLQGAPAEVVAAYNRLSALRQAFALALPTASSHEAAMIAAGYAPQTARKKAGEAAKHPDVIAVVNWIVSQAVVQAKDSVERLVEELCRIGYTDPITIFDDDDNLLPIREWPEDMRRALSGIEILEEYQGQGKNREYIGRTKKVKFWDKGMSLERVAKIKGYLKPEQHEVTHRIAGLAGLLQEIDGSDCGPGPARSRRD